MESEDAVDNNPIQVNPYTGARASEPFGHSSSHSQVSAVTYRA
jgi:hypothetical protein